MDLWTWVVKRLACGKGDHVTIPHQYDPNHNGDRNLDASQNDHQANGNHPTVIFFITTIESKHSQVTSHFYKEITKFRL